MALPVIQIMNQLQRGVREEIDDISDEETMADEEDGDIEVQAEEEEEVGENFQDTELELLDGDREDTKWLVKTRSLGALRAPTSSLRPFGPS